MPIAGKKDEFAAQFRRRNLILGCGQFQNLRHGSLDVEGYEKFVVPGPSLQQIRACLSRCYKLAGY